MDAKKVQAEIGKLIAETSRINAEPRWCAFGAGAFVFGAFALVAKIVL